MGRWIKTDRVSFRRPGCLPLDRTWDDAPLIAPSGPLSITAMAAAATPAPVVPGWLESWTWTSRDQVEKLRMQHRREREKLELELETTFIESSFSSQLVDLMQREVRPHLVPSCLPAFLPSLVRIWTYLRRSNIRRAAWRRRLRACRVASTCSIRWRNAWIPCSLPRRTDTSAIRCQSFLASLSPSLLVPLGAPFLC